MSDFWSKMKWAVGVNGEDEFNVDFQEEDESFFPLNEMSRGSD